MSQAHMQTSLTHARPCAVDPSLEIEVALAELAELERCFDADRESLSQWSGPEAIKMRLMEQLEARHARDRQPLIQKLADLQREMTTARMFGSLASTH